MIKFLSSLFKKPSTRAGQTRLAILVTAVSVLTGINIGPIFQVGSVHSEINQVRTPQ